MRCGVHSFAYELRLRQTKNTTREAEGEENLIDPFQPRLFQL